MGMRVGSSGGSAAAQNAAISNWQQRRQSFKDLTAALQASDPQGAQKAYASLTGGKVNGTGNGSGTSPLAQIGQALQNGDLAGAQKAMQTLQANRGGHHHHHHAQASTGASTASAPASAPDPNASVGGSVDTVA